MFNFNFNFSYSINLKLFKNEIEKNLIVFGFLFVTFLLPSCNSENENSANENSANENSKQISTKLEKMDSFFGSKIAVSKGTDLEVVVEKVDVLFYAEEALKDTGFNLKPKDFKIIDQNNKKYLRIYSNDDYVSTVELILENGSYKIAKTVCTSKVCASGGGCIPNGDYCTACEYAKGTPSTDCTRTRTGG